MLAAQGKECPICGTGLHKFHIDHDHATNRVRGLLCHRCNVRLGVFDDPKWRDAAMKYLEAAR